MFGFDLEARRFPLLRGLFEASILEGFPMFLGPRLCHDGCLSPFGKGMLSIPLLLRMSGSSRMDQSDEFTSVRFLSKGLRLRSGVSLRE